MALLRIDCARAILWERGERRKGIAAVIALAGKRRDASLPRLRERTFRDARARGAHQFVFTDLRKRRAIDLAHLLRGEDAH